MNKPHAPSPRITIFRLTTIRTCLCVGDSPAVLFSSEVRPQKPILTMAGWSAWSWLQDLVVVENTGIGQRVASGWSLEMLAGLSFRNAWGMGHGGMQGHMGLVRGRRTLF